MSHPTPTDERARAFARAPRHAAPPRSRLDVFLGITGELLIASGVILGLFVVWQLFYTDVTSDREQEQIVEDFVASITVDSGETDTVVDDADEVEITQTIPADLQRTDDAPVLSEPGHAETFAAMYVPRWGEDYAKPIAEGVDKAGVLNVIGIGHYPDTAMPGEWGNFAVAAHRTTYGKPFTDVDLLRDGDAIVVQTEEAWFVYEVTDHEIVLPQDVRVIAPVPNQPGAAPDDRYITLTTCHPKFSAAQRWIVHGELKYWAPTGHGIPPEMLEDVA